jgi:hypothetical protein
LPLRGGEGRSLTANDSWNHLSVDVSGWRARTAVSRIEIGFRGAGSDTTWTPRCQVDSVGWKS